jgi:hypothetical protein
MRASPHVEGEYRDNQLWELEILSADSGKIIKQLSAEVFEPRPMFDGSS